MFAWDPASERWSERGREVVTTGAGLFLDAHAKSIAVLGGPSSDVHGVAFRVDASTGSATRVPDLPFLGKVCVGRDGRLTAISSGSGVRLEVAVLDGGRWPAD